MKDYDKQMQFAKHFNSEVFNIIEKASLAMNVNPEPDYDHVMK
jgi:hypothetical protein